MDFEALFGGREFKSKEREDGKVAEIVLWCKREYYGDAKTTVKQKSNNKRQIKRKKITKKTEERITRGD